MIQAMSRIGSTTYSKYYTEGHAWPCQGFQMSTISHPAFVSVIPKYKNKYDFLREQSLGSFNTVRKMVAYSGVQPGSSPPDPSPGSWLPRKMLLRGMVISTILPFWTNKWGPFEVFQKQVIEAMETVEDIAVFVEKVALGVEKVAEHVADDLPEGGKLKDVVIYVEKVAETAVKDARLVEELIDKVEELGKQVKSLVDPLDHQANGTKP